MEFLIFKANHEHDYAINIADLQGIVPIPALISVPMTPPAVAGMISLDGELIPIVDTAKLFSDDTELTDLAVICRGKQKYGILIESVREIVRGDIPEDCLFLDVLDMERDALSCEKKTAPIELF